MKPFAASRFAVGSGGRPRRPVGRSPTSAGRADDHVGQSGGRRHRSVERPPVLSDDQIARREVMVPREPSEARSEDEAERRGSNARSGRHLRRPSNTDDLRRCVDRRLV